MISTTLFPGKYIQGYDAIKKLGPEILRFGNTGFLISSPTIFKKILPDVIKEMDAGIKLISELFQGECCEEEITRMQNLAQKSRCDVIIGMGGGKTLDVAKTVGYGLKIPVIIVPTIASSDAPCTALSVIYSPKGEFNRLMFLPSNPDVVLVDSKIIVQSPIRYLVAGMGDALSTMFEVDSCRRKYVGNMPGQLGSLAIFELANLTYNILIEYGLIAKRCCEKQLVLSAVEHVIEANTLLSGLCHESGGAAAAHAINNGFTIFEEAHKALHGELVGFGTLASLFLTDKPKDLIDRVYTFSESVGLPTTLSDIGFPDISDSNIMKVAEASCKPGESIYHELIPISVDEVCFAIKAADFEGRRRRGNMIQ